MKFIRTFFILSLILTMSLVGFIYSIDPYDKYGINVFGFETKAVAMARENKFNMVEHAKKDYKVFIIGSSSAHRLNTNDVKAYLGLETFNYAVQHTTPEDYLAITRHILAKAKPKYILFQMDFYGLNKNFRTDTRFYTSPLKTYLLNKNETHIKNEWFDSDYFTLGAISDSMKVIWVNLAGKVNHLYLEDGNYQKEKEYNGPVLITQYGYKGYEISQDRVKLLAEIKRLCDERNVKLIVWTAPYSIEHIKKIAGDPEAAKALGAFKLTLRNVFGEFYDFTNNFVAPYNSPKYFRDSSHPTREFFQILLKSIFKK